jgi:hypothetical protein
MHEARARCARFKAGFYKRCIASCISFIGIAALYCASVARRRLSDAFRALFEAVKVRLKRWNTVFSRVLKLSHRRTDTMR